MTESEPPARATLGLDEIVEAPLPQIDLEATDAFKAEMVALAVAKAREGAKSVALQNERLRAEVADREQDRSERSKYADRIFTLIVRWLIWMGVVVLCEGFGPLGFDLADGVMITIVGSTTATVIGIFLIVTRYLFPGGKR